LKEQSTSQSVVFEAAVLVEAGWQDLVDEVWVLDLAPEVAKQRLMTRNGISEAEAMQRINSQISNDARKAVAHVVIDADGTQDEVRQRLKGEWEKLRKRQGK